MDKYPCTRTFVNLEDGGQIGIDWFHCPEVEKNFSERTPIVVFLPGYTGDRWCGYSKALLEEVSDRGYKFVLMNHRGCGGVPLTSRIYFL